MASSAKPPKLSALGGVALAGTLALAAVGGMRLAVYAAPHVYIRPGSWRVGRFVWMAQCAAHAPGGRPQRVHPVAHRARRTLAPGWSRAQSVHAHPGRLQLPLL